MCCILSPQALGKICRLWFPCAECVIFGTDKRWLFWEAQAVDFFLSFIRSQIAFRAEEQQLDAAAGGGDAGKRLVSGELGSEIQHPGALQLMERLERLFVEMN